MAREAAARLPARPPQAALAPAQPRPPFSGAPRAGPGVRAAGAGPPARYPTVAVVGSRRRRAVPASRARPDGGRPEPPRASDSLGLLGHRAGTGPASVRPRGDLAHRQ